MKLFRFFISQLNQPFPKRSVYGRIPSGPFFVGVFVTMFLYLFQPFGISEYPKNKFVLCVGFGVVTFVVSILYEIVISLLFRIKEDRPSWTLKKWIAHTTINVSFIAVGNYLFLQYILGWNSFYWYGLLIMMINTFLLGLFPIVFSGLLLQVRASKAFEREAESIQSERKKNHAPHSSIPAAENTPHLASDDALLSNSQVGGMDKTQSTKDCIELAALTANDTIILNLEDILYIEAMQNYVAIFFNDPTHKSSIQKKLLRNTIRNISDQLANTSIIRCHRSYLVHLIHVNDVSGNAQGLRLSLSHPEAPPIPVSRTYVPSIRKSLIS